VAYDNTEAFLVPPDIVCINFSHLHSSKWGCRGHFWGGNINMADSVTPVIVWP
jgi:hypothetical protein